MFILEEQSCGWIPNATINFIANIVDIIKIFVPILLVIMGAIEFGKAVMAQQEDQIKKSQAAFIQKVIAGAAVFFVIVLIGWILEIIDKADPSLEANDALHCMSLMLNGGYNAETIDTTKTTSSTSTSKTITTTEFIEDELKSCVPPDCECKYEKNKEICKKEANNNKNTILTKENCINRLNYMIDSYCEDANVAAKNTNFNMFINDYVRTYKEDGLSDWLESDDAKQYFTTESSGGLFTCVRAYETKTILNDICTNMVYYGN